MLSESPVNTKIYLSIKLNILPILLVCFFLAYGYFGALGSVAHISQVPITLGLLVMMGFLANKWVNGDSAFIKEINITKLDAQGLLVIIIFWLSVLCTRLSEQIAGDQLFYSTYSQSHAIYFVDKLGRMVDLIKNIQFKSLVHFISIIILFVATATIYYINTIKYKKFLAVGMVMLIFLVSRIVVIFAGGGNSPHPPLQLIPLLISSGLLGLSDFSFRLPQLFGLIIVSFYMYRNALQVVNPINSLLIAMAAPAIPLLLHVATLVESSIWTTLTWTITLLTFITNKKYDNSDWIFLVSLISVATLMRQSAFLALIPVLINYIYSEIKSDTLEIRKLITVLLPTFIFLPFLVKSILLGTPATYEGIEADFIPGHTSSINRVYYAISEGISLWVIVNTVENPWLMMSMGCFLILQRTIKTTINFISFISLLFFSFFIFYSVRPILWGMDRYQAEYIIPFVMTGAYLIFIRALSVQGKIRYVLSFSIVGYLFYGICSYISIDQSQKYTQRFKNFSIQGEQLYDYAAALAAVKNTGHAGKALILGSTYGVLPEVMAGYSVNEIVKTSNLQKIGDRSLNNTFESFPKDGIDIILVSDVENKDKIFNLLKDDGWMDWEKFVHNKSNNTIYGFIKMR